MFSVRLTRRYFRELPLHLLLRPTLDAPELCFPWGREAQAEVWREELSELRVRYAKQSARLARAFDDAARKFENKRRAELASLARRVHLRRVAAAEGYAWPGSLGRYVVEFAPDV